MESYPTVSFFNTASKNKIKKGRIFNDTRTTLLHPFLDNKNSTKPMPININRIAE